MPSDSGRGLCCSPAGVSLPSPLHAGGTVRADRAGKFYRSTTVCPDSAPRRALIGSTDTVAEMLPDRHLEAGFSGHGWLTYIDSQSLILPAANGWPNRLVGVCGMDLPRQRIPSMYGDTL